MIRISVFLAALLLASPAVGQDGAPVPPPAAAALTPEAVVLAYTDAANRNDLEAFLALYDPEIRKYRFPDILASQGIDHMRRVYTASFAAKPGIRIEILEMITLGEMVAVRDRVTGLPDGQVADEMTLYQVRDGRIASIVYVHRTVQ